MRPNLWNTELKVKFSVLTPIQIITVDLSQGFIFIELSYFWKIYHKQKGVGGTGKLLSHDSSQETEKNKAHIHMHTHEHIHRFFGTHTYKKKNKKK